MSLMNSQKEWDTAGNAALYQAFSKRYGYYKKAGEALAEAAAIMRHHHVVDFGCGVGVSTRPIIPYLGENGRITGIDPAGSMIAGAKRQKWPGNVAFIRGDLDTLAALTQDTGVERILCSSAVWLVSGIATIAALIHRSLTGDGLFAVTMPAELLGESSHLTEKNAARFWQTFLDVREYLKLEPPEALDVDPTLISLSAWRSALQEAGFRKMDTKRFGYELTHDEWLAHLSIPVILRNYLPSASGKQRTEFLMIMRNQINPNLEAERRWIILTAHK